MKKPTEPTKPSTPKPHPSGQSGQASRAPLSRLRGEDAYDIFADHATPDHRERLRREREEGRW